jgi:hypothetical protein
MWTTAQRQNGTRGLRAAGALDHVFLPVRNVDQLGCLSVISVESTHTKVAVICRYSALFRVISCLNEVPPRAEPSRAFFPPRLPHPSIRPASHGHSSPMRATCARIRIPRAPRRDKCAFMGGDVCQCAVMCGHILARARALIISSAVPRHSSHFPAAQAVDGEERVQYGLKWRGEPIWKTAESSAEAEDPMNLIQVMLAKGSKPTRHSLPWFC